MYLKIFPLLLVSLLILNSCEYSPTETYYKDITISPPGIDLVILDENELNFLRGIVYIDYSIVLNDKELILIKAYIDEEVVESSSYDDGVLEIDTRDFTDGAHNLKFELMTSTETGSLADRVGSEVFIVTKEYSIYILNDPITPPEIVDMYVSDGALRVRWEKYEGPGFQKYILANYNISICEVYDQDSLECIDYGYIGGHASRILITVVAGSPFASSSKTFDSPTIQFISANLIDDNKIQLEWERNTFDSAFSYYKIYLGHYDDPNAYVRINDINTTSYIDTNPVFGGPIEYGLLAMPKTEIIMEPYPSSITAPAIGQEFNYTAVDFFEYVPALNSYFVYSNHNLWVYDLSFNITNSAQYSFGSNYPAYSADISSNGELFYIVQSSGNSTVAKINITTLQVEQTYSLNDIAGFDIGYIDGICISDNNLLLVLAGEYQIQTRTYVFDLNTESLVTSVVFSDSYISYDIKISNNGKYVRTQDDLYKLENSTLIFLGNVSRESLFLEDSEYLVDIGSINYNTIQIIKCADLSVQKEYAFPSTLYIGAKLDVDKKDGYIGVESSSRGHYYILDMQNLVLKKTIPITDYYYTYQNKAIFGKNRAMYVTF